MMIEILNEFSSRFAAIMGLRPAARPIPSVAGVRPTAFATSER